MLVVVSTNRELPSCTLGGSENKEQEPLRRRQHRKRGLSAVPFLPVPALLLHTSSQTSGSALVHDLGIMITYRNFGQAETHQTSKKLHLTLSTEQEHTGEQWSDSGQPTPLLTNALRSPEDLHR